MRVLYKRPERIFKTIFSLFTVFSAVFLTDAVGTNLVYAQNPPAPAQDWTLPFKPCTGIVSNRSDIKQIASDNDRELYISTTQGTLESINITPDITSDLPGSNETNSENNSENNTEANTYINPVYKSNWQITLGSEIVSNISSDDKNIYAASKSVQGSELIKLRAISKLTGITNWQTDLKKTVGIRLIQFKHLYVLADTYLLTVDTNTGATLKETMQNFGTLAERDVYSINVGNSPSGNDPASDISLSTKVSTNYGIDPKTVTRLAENAGTVLIGSKNGDLQAFGKNRNKNLWRGKVGGAITSITFFGQNKVLIGSMDNFLYMFNALNGNLIWKRRLANRLTEKPLIVDKIAFIANNGDSKAFMVELSGGKVINQISLPESYYFTANSLFINSKALLSTNRGIILYSRNRC